METLLLPRQTIISTAEIAYLQSDSNYTSVITRSKNRNHYVALSLCKIQASLTPENFVRINRSYIININYVKRFERRRGGVVCLTLANNKKLLSSRRRTALVLNSLNTYLNTSNPSLQHA